MRYPIANFILGLGVSDTSDFFPFLQKRICDVMSEQEITTEIIEYLKQKALCVGNTDFLTNSRKIRTHLKSVYPTMTNPMLAHETKIAIAILIERKVLSVWSFSEFGNRHTKEIFKVHSEALING